MKIIAFSDTHCQQNKITLPLGDVLIFAGDCSGGRNSRGEIEDFIGWYGSHRHKYKIMIAGNHDFGFEREPKKFEKLCEDNGIIYLNDTSTTVMGVKVHGSPVTPVFFNWAFNRTRTIGESMEARSLVLEHGFIGNHWDKIPEDTDILITHGPPYGILDKDRFGSSVGCNILRRHLDKRLNVKLSIFGHIHESQGIEEHDGTVYANVSSLNEKYSCQKRTSFTFDWGNF